MKTLLKGGCVLTLDRRVANLEHGDVLIDGGRIAEIGDGVRARDAEVIDCSDAIVMPGFVDAHRHAWRSLFRNAGLAADGTVISASTFAEFHEPEDLYAATLIGLLGAIGSGTTTVVDWADVPMSPDHADAVLQAHFDSGVRTVFVLPADGGAPVDAVSARVAGSELTSLALGASDPTSGNLDIVSEQMARARALGVRIHAHCGTTSSRGAVSLLGGRDLLGPDVTLVHGTNLDDADLDAVAKAGAEVVLTPSTEMALGLGTPPIQSLIDREIGPGLGVDDESIAPGDVFAQIRAAISIQHATLFEQKLAGKTGVPKLMTTREVIRHGTTDGARVSGLSDTTGSLAPGMAADVVVLRTDRPNIYPINDPIGAVVWGMDTSNVDWVFVAGTPVLVNGELSGDSARARSLAVEARQRVAGAAGLLARSEGGGSR